jgi:hypothetical protein
VVELVVKVEEEEEEEVVVVDEEHEFFYLVSFELVIVAKVNLYVKR